MTTNLITKKLNKMKAISTKQKELILNSLLNMQDYLKGFEKSKADLIKYIDNNQISEVFKNFTHLENFTPLENIIELDSLTTYTDEICKIFYS